MIISGTPFFPRIVLRSFRYSFCIEEAEVSWGEETSFNPKTSNPVAEHGTCFGIAVFGFNGSTWKVEVREEPGGTWHFSATPSAAQTGVTMALIFDAPDWKESHELFMPGLIYRSNRFDLEAQDYPPVPKAPRLGLHEPPRITDIPRLKKEPGDSCIQVLAGALTSPQAAWWDPAGRQGWIVGAEPFSNGRQTGFVFREPAERTSATLEVETPGMRQGTRYTMCSTNTRSDDRAANLSAGESLSLRVRFHPFSCPEVSSLFNELFDNRGALVPEPILHDELPFDAAREILGRKYQACNWNEEYGFYAIGDGNHWCASWQAGWVGGLMNTQPLLEWGDAGTRDRVRRTFDFVFAGDGIGKAGFFEPCFHRGTWFGDGLDRNPQWPNPQFERSEYAMTRKSADVLYFVLRQFDLWKKIDPGFEIPSAWREGARRCADAFVSLWQRTGQIGQFVHRETGEVIYGGTASAGILPAGLVLAADYFDNERYLEEAGQIGDYFYENFTRAGLTNGGPGEILQSPDSESSAGLAEAFIVLWERTQEHKWLQRAVEAARQLATWQISYDFEFPASSEFGRLGIRSAGGIFASPQNGHGAPGICTLSGNVYLKLYRATGDARYLTLLRHLAHNLTQYLSRKDRQIYSICGRQLPEGWMCERLNTGDWDDNVGGVFYGSCWCEVSLMLTIQEIPGIYIRRGPEPLLVCFDHVRATLDGVGHSLVLENPTSFEAEVSILVDDCPASPLGQNAIWNAPRVRIPAGESVHFPLPPTQV
ncbi:MAG: hypothetical protein NTV93_16960 [Verrucomicrobia bacterium]|nr:hypothetical protein [Verrucomicrobiota bacterium]